MLNFEEFRRSLISLEAHSPEVSVLRGSDHIHSEQDLREAETRLRLTVPPSLGEVLTSSGFGYYGTHEILSLRDSDRRSYVLDRAERAGLDLAEFLTVSPDETGLYYGFVMAQGESVDSRIYVVDTTQPSSDPLPVSPSIFDFIWTVALANWPSGHLSPGPRFGRSDY